MKYEVKKIGVWTTAEVFAVFGLLTGIVLGIVTAVYITIMISQFSNQNVLNNLATQYGVPVDSLQSELETQIWTLEAARKNSLIWLPIISIVFSFVLGFIFALLYNLVARWKGLTIELKEKQAVQQVHQAEHKEKKK